jgi:hypothetical protein
MANNPIVIGPFPSVPAPGSPIASPWSQQITRAVAGIQAGISNVNSDGNACVFVTLPYAYANVNYYVMLSVLGGGTATTAVARHLSLVQASTTTTRFLVRYFDAAGNPIASTFAPFHWMTYGVLA